MYRYRLDREVQRGGRVIAFFGVNPSTAGAEIEDATTRKWRGFALRQMAGKYIAGNIFGWRATDVRQLAAAVDPVGIHNGKHLGEIIEEADILVPCWGSRDKLPEALHVHVNQLVMRLMISGKPVKIFGLTKSGDPRHPLMLGYDTPLVDWPDLAPAR